MLGNMAVYRFIRDRVVVRSGFDPEYVEAMKGAIPPQFRHWNSDERVWEFDPGVWPAVRDLLTAHGYNLTRTSGSFSVPGAETRLKDAEEYARREAEAAGTKERTKREQEIERQKAWNDGFQAGQRAAGVTGGGGDAKPTSTLLAYRELGLLETAPKEVVEAAYRALAKLYHSDVGGNDEKMKRINMAHDLLKEMK